LEISKKGDYTSYSKILEKEKGGRIMRNIFYPVFSLALAMVISGALYAGSISATDRYKAEVEVLHGITVEPETVSIDVRSSGCTDESDFKWVLKKNPKTDDVMVTVIRIVPDLCKAFEHNVTLTFKRSEIGLSKVDTFSIRNQFRGFPRF
jgi:hypothetical protein